jgi:hypothetical protein
MPCFVIFWLLLRPSFFSRPRSFPMMPMPAAEVAVVAIVEVEGACAPEVFMAAPFTPDGSMAEAGATMQEVRGQAIRSPVVLAVQVTPLRAVPVVRSPVIPEAIRDMAIEARLTVLLPSVRPPPAPMDTTTTTTTTVVIRTRMATGSVPISTRIERMRC